MLCLWALACFTAEGAGFRAGAARVDITPPEGAALPMSGYAGRTEGFRGIFDRLFVRALVLDDGTRQAAVIAFDLSSAGEKLWDKVSRRIEAELRIPREHILLAATHTHAAPTLGYLTDDPSAPQTAYTTDVENRLVEAVRLAQLRLQPARIGAGAGKSSVNMNRRALMADGTWWLGRDPEGPSDKTLAVIKIESAAGTPVAVFMNYAVHGVVLGPKNMNISGDLPGAAARFVEQRLGGDTVALWTSGAAGDQNPIYNSLERTEEAEVLGRLLGEEAVRVAGGLRMTAGARLAGVQKVITCPGKKSPGGSRRQFLKDYKMEDADPVNIRLSLLRIGDIALSGVSGEVLTMIGARLKNESPLKNTIMLTHCNGSSGYIPDDEAYARVSYEIVSARIKPGCAETAIVNGFLELMERY